MTEVYWIARSFPNKIRFGNIHYWTLASSYRETRDIGLLMNNVWCHSEMLSRKFFFRNCHWYVCSRISRLPLRYPKELLNYFLSSFDMLNYMGSIFRGVMNLLRLYCMVDVTNIDILEIMWNSWKSGMSW